MRGLDHYGDVALLHRALQVGRAAGALGHQIERHRRAVVHHAEQREVQGFRLRGEVPGRLRLATQRERGVHGGRRGAGHADIHACAVAACHQADARRRTTQRRGEHARGREVGGIAIARRVAAVHAERATVAGDGQLLGMHVAVADVDAAGGACDVDEGLAALADQEAVDLQHVRLDRQRHFDLR